MILVTLLSVGLLVGSHCGVDSSTTCHDLDTQSCIGFHAGKPDLCDDPTFSQTLCKHFCGNCPLECYSCPNPVMHPDDCKNTTTCAPKMECVNRHLRAKDGHHEYILSCESKEMCNFVLGGFGKRSLDDLDGLSDEDRERYERDVILNCCDTDLCNFELLTTLPTTTTPRPTTTTPKPTTTTTRATTTVPRVCNKDVIFVMQTYMDQHHAALHHQQFSVDHWVPFIEQIIPGINVASNATHVAVATFDSHTKIQWELDKHDSLSSLQHALSNIDHDRVHQGATNLHDLFNKLRGHVFDGGNGDRQQAGNVVVFLENGGLSHPDGHNMDSIQSEIATIHNVADNVIIVSVGAVPDALHYGIATDNNHMAQVSDYSELHSLVPQIINLICS